MIDLLKITIEGMFPQMGKLGRIGETTVFFTKECIRIHGDGPEYWLQVREAGREIYLAFCPLKILQGHNGIGSNDVGALVEHAVRAIFKDLDIPLTRRVERRLQEGDYLLHEVHIAELHAMSHPLIPALCNAIRRYAPASLEAIPICPGVGIRLWPNSRYRRVLIYDKEHYFRDKPAKHQKLLLAAAKRFLALGLKIRFGKMLKYLRQGVRIEARLLAPYLKEHKLDRGYAWNAEVARREHLKMLSTIPIQNLPPISRAESVLTQLSGIQKAMVALWLEGRNPLDYASSRSTFYRHRQVIRARSGIDLTRPAVDLPEGVEWQALLSARSILATPSWALDSGFVFDPARPTLSCNRV
jgi:hypothetical protein